MPHRPAVTPSPSPQSRSELTTQLAVACLGAGARSPRLPWRKVRTLSPRWITLFSAVAAVMVGQVLDRPGSAKEDEPLRACGDVA
jgi:hypothetical protein